MKEVNQKKFVYTETNKKIDGFTLISLLFGLLIIVITFPLVAQLLQITSHSTTAEDISYRQFFLFIRDDIDQAKNVYVKNNVIYFELFNGDIAMLEKYNDQIRRRVNGEGHEVYLREVKQFRIVPDKHQFTIIIESTKGEIYDKVFEYSEPT